MPVDGEVLVHAGGHFEKILEQYPNRSNWLGGVAIFWVGPVFAVGSAGCRCGWNEFKVVGVGVRALQASPVLGGLVSLDNVGDGVGSAALAVVRYVPPQGGKATAQDFSHWVKVFGRR